jgi:hypothetical protein
MQTSEALDGCDFWTLQRRAAEAHHASKTCLGRAAIAARATV